MKFLERTKLLHVVSFILIGIGIVFLLASLRGIPQALNTLHNYNCAVGIMIVIILGLTGVLGISIGIGILRQKRI